MVHEPQLQNLCSKCKPTYRKIRLAIIHNSGACHHKLGSYKLIISILSPAHQKSIFFPRPLHLCDSLPWGNHKPHNPRHIFHSPLLYMFICCHQTEMPLMLVPSYSRHKILLLFSKQ